MVTLMGRSPSDGQHKNLGLEKAAGNEMPGTKQEAEATEEGKINSEVEVWKKKKKKKKKAKRCRPQKFRGTYLQSDFLPVRSSGSAEAGTLMVQVQQLASERRSSTLPIRKPTANQRRGFSNMRYGLAAF
jgi:hypothetical protein